MWCLPHDHYSYNICWNPNKPFVFLSIHHHIVSWHLCQWYVILTFLFLRDLYDFILNGCNMLTKCGILTLFISLHVLLSISLRLTLLILESVWNGFKNLITNKHFNMSSMTKHKMYWILMIYSISQYFLSWFWEWGHDETEY